MRFSAVGPEIVRGGVLRKFVENKAILRFLAVCVLESVSVIRATRVGCYKIHIETILRFFVVKADVTLLQPYPEVCRGSS